MLRLFVTEEKEEKYEREIRRRELREKPEVQQWLKHMVRSIHETEVRMNINQFNKLNRLKQKAVEQPTPLFSFTLGAHDDKVKNGDNGNGNGYSNKSKQEKDDSRRTVKKPYKK